MAAQLWPGQIGKVQAEGLKYQVAKNHFNVVAGDLQFLQGKWYVTHTGLLRLAHNNRCAGIEVRPLSKFCDPAACRWAFKATVYKSRTCRGFVGYGDADPSNVSPVVRGAEMRIAETRAVNRALRKAYGIGICSVEELGSFSGPLPRAAQSKKPAAKDKPVNGIGHHPLRDRLCLLMRQHQLDPALVKAYAADYCDVSELRQASREQVATFIKHLTEYAQSDREGLLCQLNSYAAKPVAAAPLMDGNDCSHFCDWRVAARGDFKLGFSEVQVGIPLPPVILAALRRQVGPRQAERLAVGGLILSPEEALTAGLVDELTPSDQVLEHALAWCRSLLALPVEAMLATRRRARADLVALFDQDPEEELRRVVDVWWSPETQNTLHALVERMGKKATRDD